MGPFYGEFSFLSFPLWYYILEFSACGRRPYRTQLSEDARLSGGKPTPDADSRSRAAMQEARRFDSYGVGSGRVASWL